MEEIFLSVPIDIVRSFHNAFRRDISQIDDYVFNIARVGGDLAPVFDRLEVSGEILDYHAKGEEAAVFPAVDKIAPLVARAYLLDHQKLDSMIAELDGMRKKPDPLTAARATAVLASHLRIHLYKEDVYLYPILSRQATNSEQAAIVGLMSKKVPSDKFPTFINWLFPLIGLDDRVVIIKGWMNLMPPQVFAGVKPLIKKAVAEKWIELSRQIPELDAK